MSTVSVTPVDHLPRGATRAYQWQVDAAGNPWELVSIAVGPRLTKASQQQDATTVQVLVHWTDPASVPRYCESTVTCTVRRTDTGQVEVGTWRVVVAE